MERKRRAFTILVLGTLASLAFGILPGLHGLLFLNLVLDVLLAGFIALLVNDKSSNPPSSVQPMRAAPPGNSPVSRTVRPLPFPAGPASPPIDDDVLENPLLGTGPSSRNWVIEDFAEDLRDPAGADEYSDEVLYQVAGN